MPDVCVVTGSFSQRGKPVEGWVRFTPSQMWVIEHGVAWACLAPTVDLELGGFAALLTPTDSGPVPWHYVVETPAGVFKIALSGQGSSYDLRELVENPPSGPQ